MNIPHINIKSILYDLSEIIPKRYWNETKFLEWAVKGLYRVNTNPIYTERVKLLKVEDHRAQLPNDFKMIIQVAGRIGHTTAILEELQSTMGLSDVDITHMSNPTATATNVANALYGQLSTN